MRLVLQTLLTFFCITAFSSSHADINIHFNEAQFVASEQKSSNTKMVKLPHIWQRDEVTDETHGWYYLTFNLDEIPTSLLALYVRRLNVSAEFYINDTLVKDGGIYQEPMPRYWNTPIFFNIEPNLLKIGSNQITVHLLTANDFGILSEINLANDAINRPIYQTRAFIQNDLTRLISIFYIVIALFVFSLWFRRRNEKAYLYLALALFTWALASSSYFVLTPWFSTRFYLWLVYTNVIWSTIFMLIVALEYIQLPIQKLKKILFTYGAIGTTIYTFTSGTNLPQVSAVVIPFSLLFAWYAIFQLFKHAIKSRKIIPFLIAISFLLLQLAGIHDWASTAGLIPSSIVYQLQLTSYVGVLFIMVVTLEISNRFALSLNQTEKLNNELEDRVKQKSLELEQQYKELQVLQKDKAITEERERIYQDLHDDVGAKILSLVYRGENNENQDIARAALQDLRDVVSRSSKTNNTLNELMADWHAEAESRLESANIDLDWIQKDEFKAQIVSSIWALNLGRILREAISNIIKHTNSKNASIYIICFKDYYQIKIEDFNNRVIEQNSFSGRGINNMKARCKKLNGTITWHSKATGGCTVVITLSQIQ